MNYFVQFQINLFALTILAVLLVFIRLSHIRTFGRRLIEWLLCTSAIAIIDEPLTWILDRELFFGSYALLYASNFLLFLLAPVIGGLLMSYVDYRLYQNPKRLRCRLFYQHASILTLAVLVANFWFPLYFFIRPEENSYGSGPLKLVHFAVVSLMYLQFLIFIAHNRQKKPPKEILIYAIFFFFPILGMLMQLLDSKLHFAWTSVVIGLLVIYIFLESTPSDVDYLTKLYNRSSFDTHLHFLLQGNKKFGLVMFDLNYFKQINDQHGHKAGDQVLIGFASALKEAFASNALAFRLGGDEFAVITTSLAIDSEIQTLQKSLHHHHNPLLASLSFSYGFQMSEPGLSNDTLTNMADHSMYKHKNEMKRLRS